MKKRNRLFLILIIPISGIIVLYILFFFIGEYIIIPASIFNSCRSDNECVIVKKDCCGCDQDGEATIINEKYLAAWEKINSIRCNVLCNQITSDHPSCFARPKCVNNKCQLIPDQ